MGNTHPVSCQQPDLVRLYLDAVHRENRRAEQALPVEQTQPGRPRRLDEEVQALPRAASVPQVAHLGAAFRDVRRERESEPEHAR